MNNKTNLEKVVFYGDLTALVDEEHRLENFRRGLSFSKNYFSLYSIARIVHESFSEEGIQVLTGFDYLSKDENVNTFKVMTFEYNKSLDKFLSDLSKDKNFMIDFTKKASIKNSTITITII